MKRTSELPRGPTVFSADIPKMHHFGKYAPLPDTCNSGPVIVLDCAGPATGMDNPVLEPKVVMRKRCSPPPWQALKPCSSPCCSARIHVGSLGHPGPLLSCLARQRCQAGNLLQCLPTPGENLQLFQAVNTKEESILSLYDIPSSFETQGKLIDRQMSFRKGYEVYDLECRKIQDQTFMLCRGSHQVDLHRLCNDSLEFCNVEWKSDVLLTSACLSQSYGDKWLETNECQQISLKNCERVELSVWSQHLPDCALSGREKEWCSALFAYEDSTAVATNRTKMYLCDFRKEQPSCLLDIRQCKYGEKIEEICNMVRPLQSPYALLVMSQQIWLVDERRCDRPVITWNHLLLDQPRRSVLQSLPGLDVLMLSNNLEPRVAFASLRGLNVVNETVEHYIWSPSLIFHHDFMTPMKTFAHQKGLWFDNRVFERLSKFENSGLATAKSPDDGSFTVFVSNNAGDVFCQKFSSENYIVESESLSDETSAAVKRMKAYEKIAKELTCELGQTDQKLDVTRMMAEKLRVGNEPPVQPPLWHVGITVDKLKQSSSHNKALDGSMVFKWTDILLEDYKEDPNFFFNVGDYETRDGISKYFHSKTVEIASPEWINSCSDGLAQKILNFWPLVAPDEIDLMNCEVDGGTWYRSVPYGKRFGIPDYVKKCRPRSLNGSGHTTTGASSGASSGSRSLSGYSGSRTTVVSSTSGGRCSATGSGGSRFTPLSQELLDATVAAALLTTLSATPLPATPLPATPLPATPLPATASQVCTPSFRPTPSGLTSTAKKKRKRNAGF